jgi:hypothetical protein
MLPKQLKVAPEMSKIRGRPARFVSGSDISPNQVAQPEAIDFFNRRSECGFVSGKSLIFGPVPLMIDFQ